MNWSSAAVEALSRPAPEAEVCITFGSMMSASCLLRLGEEAPCSVGAISEAWSEMLVTA